MSGIHKRHLINQHLIDLKLVNEEQINIWESNIRTYSTNSLDASHDIAKIRRFQCNITIKNFAPKQDIDLIEFALIWWLNLYEPDHNPENERLHIEPNFKDQRITDVWIGFNLSEKSLFKNGKKTLCIKPLMIDIKPIELVIDELEQHVA